MKNFLFKNDKSTIRDELPLLLFILACIGVGVLLIIFAPANWFISATGFKMFGVYRSLLELCLSPA